MRTTTRLTLITAAIMSFVITGCTSDDEYKLPEPTYTSIDDCTHSTSKTQTLRIKDPYRLRQNPLTGNVSIKGGDTREQLYVSYHSLNSGNFYESCAHGAIDSLSEECSSYIACLSRVKHNIDRGSGEIERLSLDQAAVFLRDGRIKDGAPTGSASDKDNFRSACRTLINTSSAFVVGGAIFENVPEVPDLSTAVKLGQKIVAADDDYGSCFCVLQKYTGVKVYMPNVTCRGEKSIEAR